MAGPAQTSCYRCGTTYRDLRSNVAPVGLRTSRVTNYHVLDCRCGSLIYVGQDANAAPWPPALLLASKFG